DMDIQFKGGAMLTYGYQGDVDIKAMETDAKSVLGNGITLQTGSNVATGDKTIILSLPGTETVSTESLEKLSTKLDENYKDNKFTQLTVSNVNPTIGKEFFAKSIVAVVAASLLILLYIAFRFKKIGGWPAGSMAVVALVHDLIVIFGVFIIMRIPLNGNFIAALLTILGYSINDTVVIYDRIRENRQLMGDKMPFEELVNLSINQSLTRSINTTVSTVLALGCVCIVSGVFGLDSIFTFAFPLIIGMVSGVYSTVCIAGPLWVEWENYKLRKNPKQKSSKA
ncbi:MAG: protein translocase subunit SecF, partial [Oscillospiraceae bacterium]